MYPVRDGTARGLYFPEKEQEQVVYFEGHSEQAECIAWLRYHMPEKTEGRLFCKLQIPQQAGARKEFLYLQVQGLIC